MTDTAHVVDRTAHGTAFVVRLAHPPASQLGRPLLAGLGAAISEFEAGAARTLVICSGLGRGRALDMMLTGREVPADEALAIGLLDRLTEPGKAVETALGLAGQLGALFRPALGAVLRSADDAAELPLADGMAREAARVADLFDSPDGREGLAAFVAKRPASFA